MLQAHVKCAKTGFSAEIEFHTKSLFGGGFNKVNGRIYRIGEKKPFITLSGEWNGEVTLSSFIRIFTIKSQIYMKYQGDNKEVLFTDVRMKPDVKKVSNYQIFRNSNSTIIEFKECILVAKQGE